MAKQGKKINDFVKTYIDAKEKGDIYKKPSDDLPVAEKQKKEYFKKCAEYLFYLGSTGQLYSCGILSTDTKYGMLREYARGTLPIEKYKDDLIGRDESGQRRKTLYNISWLPDMGYINTLSQMAGGYDKMDYDLTVSAIDPSSDFERKQKVANLKINTDESLKQLAQSAGVSYIGEEPDDPEFETPEDVDIYVKAGGLKLKSEIAIQKAVNKTKDYCGWRELKSMLARDMRELGIAACKDYVDTVDYMATLRYVDPNMLLVPFSKYIDFRDITMAGELRTMSIADLRNETDFDEMQLYRIAKEYGYKGTTIFDNSIIERMCVEEGMPYDHVIVYVLDASWLSADLSYYTEKVIDKYGVLEFKEKDYKYKLSAKEEKNGKQLKKYRRQYTYKTSWIVGTDCVFNYGKDYFQTREGENGNKKGVLPYHIVTTGEPSKLGRIIADIDAINILTYKRRNAIANIPAPPGYVIDKSALENVQFNGEIQSPTELMRRLVEGGALVVDTLNEFGDKTVNINGIVGYISTNLLEQFRIYYEQINEHRRNIQLATGYNDLVDGSADTERQLKVQGEAKLEAANNAMQMEYAAMRTLIQKSYRNIIRRWQEIARNRDIELKYIPLNSEDVQTIKLTSDIADNKFDLRVKLSASENERRMLLQELTQLKAVRMQNGSGGISEADYIMLYRVIMEDSNISLAQLLLAQAKDKQAKEDHQKALDMQQANAKVQMQSTMVAEEEKRKTLLLETACELIKNQHKSMNTINEIVAKADLEDGQADSDVLRQLLTTVQDPTLVDQMIMKAQQSIMNFGQNQVQQPQGIA